MLKMGEIDNILNICRKSFKRGCKNKNQNVLHVHFIVYYVMVKTRHSKIPFHEDALKILERLDAVFSSVYVVSGQGKSAVTWWLMTLHACTVWSAEPWDLPIIHYLIFTAFQWSPELQLIYLNELFCESPWWWDFRIFVMYDRVWPAVYDRYVTICTT